MSVQRAAESVHVQIVHCDVIYDAVEALERRLLASDLFPRLSSGAAPKGTSKEHAAVATVKQIFPLSNVGVSRSPHLVACDA